MLQVYLDVQIGSDSSGRIVIELRYDAAPKTAENFLRLCDGHNGYSFVGSRFHRVMPDFMIQGGIITLEDGSLGQSIYGGDFPDESFDLKHAGPGVVSMANSGPNTNNTQFFITTVPVPWLNNKHVVFGQVVKGMDVVKKIESKGTASGKPSEPIVIVGSGIY